MTNLRNLTFIPIKSEKKIMDFDGKGVSITVLICLTWNWQQYPPGGQYIGIYNDKYDLFVWT